MNALTAQNAGENFNQNEDKQDPAPRHGRPRHCEYMFTAVYRLCDLNFGIFVFVSNTECITFEAMKKTTIKQVPGKVDLHSEAVARVVKTYRIAPAVAEKADELCRKQHDVGLATFIEPLLVAYFKIDTTKLKGNG